MEKGELLVSESLSKILAFNRLYFLQNDNLIPPKTFYNHSSVSVTDLSLVYLISNKGSKKEVIIFT